MFILYIGDIMGPAGIKVVAKVLPKLKKQYPIDMVIVQGENVSNGRGLLPVDMKRLMEIGVEFFTGGNHTPYHDELSTLLKDENSPVIGPANLIGTPGKGWKWHISPAGRVLVVSILGSVVGRDAQKPTRNPLQTVDNILKKVKDETRAAVVVNFHGDYSSEKVVIGQYLDGRVSAVIGDHWHVPTADARILPAGTAHITDVGMCGVLNSSLGVKTANIVQRWRDDIRNQNELETLGPFQFNAVLIDVDEKTQLASNITPINQIIEGR